MFSLSDFVKSTEQNFISGIFLIFLVHIFIWIIVAISMSNIFSPFFQFFLHLYIDNFWIINTDRALQCFCSDDFVNKVDSLLR